jgi:DNA-binding transcriptional LysR family regulator
MRIRHFASARGLALLRLREFVMEVHQIRYFLALSEELNFTRAAERCSVAQSSLTRAIRALENELGGPLFHRERTNSHLSKLGLKVHPFLAQAYSHVEGARRQAQDFLRLQTCTLRLGLMSAIAPAPVAALIGALKIRHSGIALHAIDGAAQALQDRLLAGELDAAIYALPDLAADGRLDHLPLYREPFVIVVSDAHPLADRGAVRAAELAGEPMLWRSQCEYEAATRQSLARFGADRPAVLQSERDDWIVAMAATGLGFGFVPACSAVHPGIAALRLTEPEVAREVSLVTLRGRPDSAAIGALVHEVTRIRWTATAPQAASTAADSRALAEAGTR